MIPNLGEKKFVAVTEAGTKRKMTAQVCEVNKALLSVSKTVQAGNRVVFASESDGGSFIEDVTTGERLFMTERHGVYVLKMWVAKGGAEDF